MGNLLDQIANRVRYATQSGMPTGEIPDALPWIGWERQLPQGPGESNGDYTERLRLAWDAWKWAGTPVGFLSQLYIQGFSGGFVVVQLGVKWSIVGTPDFADLSGAMTELPSWVSRDVLPNSNPPIPLSTDGKPAIAANTIPWWSMPGGPMDGAGDQWNGRFAIVYPDGQPPSPLTDADNLTRIRTLIRKWKPAKYVCTGIFVTTGGIVYGTDHEYGDGSLYGGSTEYYSAT
jgi:hypothetical protein